MPEKIFIGIDTSNYTTSMAVVSSSGEVVCNIKKLLPVKDGNLGLRQSDAVFEHIKQIPSVAKELNSFLKDKYGNNYEIIAIGCSDKPRDRQDSYMPCFLSGLAVAETLASILDCPLNKFSHQKGHVLAALYSCNKLELIKDKFVAFHVSGGTTEILLVSPSKDNIVDIEEIGRTLDLNAGQAIDRAGVMIGLPFPAGSHLEKLALNFDGKIEKNRISVRGLECNLSGLENHVKKLVANNKSNEYIAMYVLDFVGRTLEKLSNNLNEQYGSIPIVYAGGVMSCSIIKQLLKADNRYFAMPVFSSDNAAGIAVMSYLKNNK